MKELEGFKQRFNRNFVRWKKRQSPEEALEIAQDIHKDVTKAIKRFKYYHELSERNKTA